jgi:hypothetical protein
MEKSVKKNYVALDRLPISNLLDEKIHREYVYLRQILKNDEEDNY